MACAFDSLVHLFFQIIDSIGYSISRILSRNILECHLRKFFSNFRGIHPFPSLQLLLYEILQPLNIEFDDLLSILSEWNVLTGRRHRSILLLDLIRRLTSLTVFVHPNLPFDIPKVVETNIVVSIASPILFTDPFL